MFKKVIITSGPTIEPIDPIRFISNRSSGKTGYYLALEAQKREIGQIVFITGPTAHIPAGVTLSRVETALEMRQELLQHFSDAEVVIMAAAVCDYRSVKYYNEKIKKNQDQMILQLIKNPDILEELGQKKRPKQILVGFAAETDHIFENANRKLKQKNLDLVVLNEISAQNPAFNEDENQVFLVGANDIQKLERMKKSAIAVHIWDEIVRLGLKKRKPMASSGVERE